MRQMRLCWARHLALLLVLLCPWQWCAVSQGSVLTFGDIQGAPSLPRVRRVVRRGPAIRKQRERTRVVYVERRTEGTTDAQRQLAALPRPQQAIVRIQQDPMVQELAKNEVRLPKEATVRLDPVQTIRARFVRQGDRPVSDIKVIPVIQVNGEDAKELPAQTTDPQGRVTLAGLKEVPARIEFKLSGEAEEVPEWRYKEPKKASVVLNDFSGNPKFALIAPRPTGVQIAGTSLRAAIAALAVAPRRRPPVRANPAQAAQAQALDLARKAKLAYDAGSAVLGGRTLAESPKAIQMVAEPHFLDAIRLAEQAIAKAPAAAAAYLYAAEAKVQLGDLPGALGFLSRGFAANPRDLGVKNRLAQIRDLISKPPMSPMPDKPVKPVEPNGEPRVVQVQYVQDLAPLEIERSVVDLDLKLPEGTDDARIHMPRIESDPALLAKVNLDEILEDAKGRREGNLMHLHLPVDVFQEGKPFPIRVSRTTAGGVFEQVTQVERANPYEKQTVEVPPLRLISVRGLPALEGLEVTGHAADAARLHPSLSGLAEFANPAPPEKKKGRDKDKDAPAAPAPGMNPDGSRTFRADALGLELQLRGVPDTVGRRVLDGQKQRDKDDPPPAVSVIEAVRVTKASTGSVAGVTVGDPEAKVRELLGDPDAGAPGTLSYLDGGVTYRMQGGAVQTIEIRRPKDLLNSGTTAFVRREAVDLYVKEFRMDLRDDVREKRLIRDREALEKYLMRSGVVRLVSSEDAADYVLTARLARFEEAQRNVDKGIPRDYRCTGELFYTLTDRIAGKDLVRNERIAETEGANWEAEMKTYLPGGLGFIDLILKNRRANDSLKQIIANAPKLVEQALYNQLSDQISTRVDYAGRVTGINYANGEIRVNLGRADGVQQGRVGENETLFDLYMNGRPLPRKEVGLSVDFYTLRAKRVDDHESVCELLHVQRKVEGKGKVSELTYAVDLEMIKQILNPATGIISARIANRLIPIDDLKDQRSAEAKPAPAPAGSRAGTNRLAARSTAERPTRPAERPWLRRRHSGRLA